MIRNWIEAMRLRTLPVSVAGVIAGTACAIILDSFKPAPAIACLVFAALAQIAANFGNEYYDYKNGIDRKGRAGFRRGVTEGEIAPKSMKMATYSVLALAAAVGCWKSAARVTPEAQVPLTPESIFRMTPIKS